MNATEIIAVIDRSGSMSAIRDDAIGGFNAFLADQKKQKVDANLTLVLFDHEYIVWDTQPVEKHKKLTVKSYVPRGSTALYDALGKSIVDLKARILKMKKKDRPDKVVFIVITDGAENSSKEFVQEGAIKKMVEDCTKNGWEFIYTGANVDAFAEAGRMGFMMSNVANFTADSRGTESALVGTSRAVASYSNSGSIDSNWKDGIK